MKREVPITHQLYTHLFPNPTATDPPSFSAHLARNLVPEVRIEVAIFYGDLNTSEARYPGLNYSHPPHRLRLGRFEHHKRLFDAFDYLGLTDQEIQNFCCWEGTKWARERYENDEGVKVVDTTGAGIGPFVDRREQKFMEVEGRRKSITKRTSISVVVEEAGNAGSTTAELEEERDQDMSDVAGEDEDVDAGSDTHNYVDETDDIETRESEEPPQEAAARQQHMSELSRRREEAINRRILAAWQQGRSLSPDIEQYLKEASERGSLGSDLQRAISRALFNGFGIPQPGSHSSIANTRNLASARRGAAA